MIGDTTLNPDGTFNFCWNLYPFLLLNCRRSYFYKVKQWNGSAWVYIYDGAAAHQYFNADQFANLETLLGQSCGQAPPPPGTDFATLQQIGSTPSYLLHSNWNGATSAGMDLTQVSAFGLSTPPANGGLVDFGSYEDAPWAQTLSFLLYFHPGLEALNAFYYRLSMVPSDASGNPLSGATPTPIKNSVSWSKWVPDGTGWTTASQNLGPNSPGGQDGLFQIPYPDDALWLGDQFHQYLDTTTLSSGIPQPDGTTTSNGRYLLVLELFDKTGKRMIPAGAPGNPGDIPTNFTYLRWLTATGTGSMANVQYPALTHLLWVDNRAVYGGIEDMDVSGIGSSSECQFLAALAHRSFRSDSAHTTS